MAVTVTTSSPGSISVQSGQRSTGAITIKRAADLTLQSLTNVNSADLDDGYTIIYDTDTNKWVTQPLANVTLASLDGGTY